MLTGFGNPTHVLLVLAVLLLVFGAKRLPEIGRGLGAGLRDFKRAVSSPSEADGAAPPNARLLPEQKSSSD
jgi:sec-independent protein translocase protein TatA